MGHSRPLFRFIFLSFQVNITILTKINVKNVQPGGLIQTHDLSNMSLLP